MPLNLYVMDFFAEFTFKVWYWALCEETGCFLTSTHSCGACRVNKTQIRYVQGPI